MKENHNRHPKTTPLGSRPKRQVTHKIREWRKHRGMTTVQVAEQALDSKGNPMTSSLIAQVEVGRCAYTQNSLERIGRALNVEPWMLLAVDPADQSSWLLVNDDDQLWSGLSTKDRQQASAFLRDMVDAVRDVMLKRWPALQPTNDNAA